MSSAQMTPADQAERTRVTHSIDETMFVVAGAGTGKTQALTERVIHLLTGPRSVPIDAIAAITFTDKAAAELRNRIRAALNERLAGAQPAEAPDAANPVGALVSRAGAGKAEQQTIHDALDGLDSAAISTLHGFARRILAEHAVEAGLPPKFETLDQIASDVAFDERWERFASELLADPDAQWAMSLVDAAGAGPADLRGIGQSFNSNWDLVRPGGAPPAAAVAVGGIVAAGRTLAGRRSECRNPADSAARRFGQLERFCDRLVAAATDAERLAVLLAADDPKEGVPKLGNSGSKSNWPDVRSIRESFAELRERCLTHAAEAVDGAIRLVCDRAAQFTLDAAEQRRRDGMLEYHDLLVRARNLLRSSPEARTALHRRYRHLLLDEFQDTDPIQIEIATLIASDGNPAGTKAGIAADLALVANGGSGMAAASTDSADDDCNIGLAPALSWRQMSTTPGQLFFVGDPKQSVYRFRRADISLYLDARERFGREAGASASLRVNFRTTAPIIDWINATFAALMPPDDSAAGAHLHPEYVALDAWREAVGGGPSVVTLGTDGHDGLSAERIREAEAADVATLIREAIEEGWEVDDRHLGVCRPAQLSDIAVLIPARTCLPQLEAGLSAAGVPYRLEASEFVWRSRTVRDLMMCLRAVSDPDDDLAVVSALRTPFYGCGDDDLYEYHRAISSWSCFASDFSPVPGGADHPVARGLRHLREMYEQHALVAPAVLADRLIRDRRMLEQAAVGPRTREVWRQLRFVVDQARAWSQSQGGGLRQFLRWTEMQASERAKVTEAILPESDDDSVRVLTVHASKGLEFPIVIVAGLQGGNRHRLDPTHVAFDHAERSGGESVRCSGAAAVRLRGGAASAGFSEWADLDRLAEHHERIRLLYVACTRARDHLVVSLHRTSTQNEDPTRASHAQLLTDAMPERVSPDAPASARRHWDYRAAGRVAAQSTVSAASDDVGIPAAPAPSRTASAEPLERSNAPGADRLAATGAGATPAAPLERSDWHERREVAVAASKRPMSISATGIARRHDQLDPAEPPDVQDRTGASSRGAPDEAAADWRLGPGPDKSEPDDHTMEGRAPARRGRGATSVGRAVHGVLQAIDFRSGGGLSSLSAAQATAEGATSSRRDIEMFVQSALASSDVQRAASSQYWREVYAAAPIGSPEATAEVPTVVEGYIDLLYEDAATGDLVVVDYKTDALGAMPEIDSPRAEQYRRQGAAYAWCIEQSTGRAVGEVVLLYLRPDGSAARADRLSGRQLRSAIGAVPRSAAALAAGADVRPGRGVGGGSRR